MGQHQRQLLAFSPMGTAVRALAVLLLLAARVPARGATRRGADRGEATYRRNIAEGAAFLARGSRSSLARALGRFKVALKQKPQSGQAYYWIALTYSDLQNHDLAAKHAEEATLCDRKLAKAWLLWGQSLMFLGKWKEAKQKLDQAEQLSEEDPLVSFNLARCYFHGFGDSSNALYLFKETVRRLGERGKHPQWRQVYVQSKVYEGICCLAKDMTLAAVSALRQALRVNRNNSRAWLLLGIALRASDRVAEAERALLNALRLDVHDCEAMLQLAHLYLVDRPNRKLARYYLTAFLKYAPASHPWRRRASNQFKAWQEAGGGKGSKPAPRLAPPPARGTAGAARR